MPKISVYTAKVDLNLVVTEDDCPGRVVTSTHVTVKSPTLEELKRKVTHLLQVLDDNDFAAGPL